MHTLEWNFKFEKRRICLAIGQAHIFDVEAMHNVGKKYAAIYVEVLK